MQNDDYNYFRLTEDTVSYLDKHGVLPDSDHMPQYCLSMPQDEMNDIGARPLLIHRCPWKDYDAGGGCKIKYDLFCITGDPITKLAEYENILVSPNMLKEIYDEYTELIKNTCYECDLYGTKDCKYPPKWGSSVRINCPFFRHQLSIEEGELTD